MGCSFNNKKWQESFSKDPSDVIILGTKKASTSESVRASANLTIGNDGLV